MRPTSIGMIIGAFQGWLVGYQGVPSFIVTLGGLMVWRGMAFLSADGRTISPVDETFGLLGGGPHGSVGAMGSWIVGILGCAAILWILRSGRASRKKHSFALRPMWAEYALAALGSFTTVSSLNLQLVSLLRNHNRFSAIFYLLFSVLGGLGLLLLGSYWGRWWW
mgnify:CR=1 FL=1